MKRVLIAGATGRLGMRLVRRFRSEGWYVRVLVRDPARLGLLRRHVHEVVAGDLTAAVPPAACEGMDLVFSCAGASTRLLDAASESSFESVNHYGNVGLLRAALRARVARFMYVSPLGAEKLAHTAYGGAHERFVDVLHRAPIDHTVIRPTVYFENLDEAVTLLGAGHPWPMGSGPARTNPIHESDLADFCVSMTGSRLEEAAVGGPYIFTRGAIAELAARAVAHRRAAGAGGPGRLRLDNNRVRELLAFSEEISRLEVVGPEYGCHDLRRHLSALTGADVERLEAPRAARLESPQAARERSPSPLLAIYAEPLFVREQR